MIELTVGDVVVLRADLPKEGLIKGQKGTVVLELTQPFLAYETEFADADGRTVAQLALSPDQVEPVSMAGLEPDRLVNAVPSRD